MGRADHSLEGCATPLSAMSFVSFVSFASKSWQSFECFHLLHFFHLLRPSASSLESKFSIKDIGVSQDYVWPENQFTSLFSGVL